MIAIKDLRELYKINPDISGKDLIELAEYYVEVIRSCEVNIKNVGDKGKIYYNGRIKIKHYKRGEQ